MKTVVGLFERAEEADQAIQALQKAGFNRNRFSIIGRNEVVQRVDRAEDNQEGTIQAEDKLGVAGGAAIGGVTGLLLGLGALVIPGIGPVVAAGTIATALGTAAAAAGMGAVAGGLIGALTSQGISEEEAHFYAEGVKRGGILVVVEADEAHVPLAAQTLREAGAVEIAARRKQWESAGWSSFDQANLPDENYPKF